MLVWATVSLLLASVLATDLCPEPSVSNGRVVGNKLENFYSGQVTCDLGYHLVGGSANIKCRHGRWSGSIPACSVIGACPELPKDLIYKGRIIPIRGSRNSAYKFKCSRGFSLLGERRTHCQGDRWSHESVPVCAKFGCDDSGMLDIPHGQAKSRLRGAVYKYECDEGIMMEGSNTIYCDGAHWNGSVPLCPMAPEAPQIRVLDSQGNPTQTTLVGDVVRVECSATGNPPPEVKILLTDDKPTSTPQPLGNSVTLTLGPEDHDREIVCSASNKVGVSTNSMTLSALSKPEEVIVSGPTMVYAGQWNEFSCQAKGGNPVPSLEWEAYSAEGETLEVVSDGDRMFLEPRSGDKELNIVCLAANGAGVVSGQMKATVASGPKSTKIIGPSLLFPGGQFDFLCEVEGGNPRPSISWEVRDASGTVLEVVSEGPHMTLTLENEHRGGLDIDCRAENKVSSVVSAFWADTAYLPSALSVSVPTEAHAGDTLTLSCWEDTPIEPMSAVSANLEWRLEGLGADLVMSAEKGMAELRVREERLEDDFVLMVQCKATVDGLEGEVTSEVKEIVVVSDRVEEISTVSLQDMVRLVPEEEEKTAWSSEDYENNAEIAVWSAEDYELEDDEEKSLWSAEEYELDEEDYEDYASFTDDEYIEYSDDSVPLTTENIKEHTVYSGDSTHAIYDEETTTTKIIEVIKNKILEDNDATSVSEYSAVDAGSQEDSLEEPERPEYIPEKTALKQIDEVPNKIDMYSVSYDSASNIPLTSSLAVLLALLVQLLR